MNSRNSQQTQRRILFVCVALIIGAVLLGVASRVQTERALRRQAEDSALTVVATTKPSLENGGEALTLPGNVQAFTDAPIYARTSGYLQRWLVDIGAKVKKGQLLAEIDTPEVDQQLLQAQADLANSEANYRLAQSTAERWTQMLDIQSVSRQETDEKIGDAAAKKSSVAAARANVDRLRQLQAFKHIEAPFSGVVTARNIDVGALVSAGSGRELFRIAASEKLRVYVQVPQTYAGYIQLGSSVKLEVAERPGQLFAGKLVHSAEAIDAVTRTLLVQIEVDNASGAILPGSYAQVHLQLPVANGLRLPVNTLIFRAEGLQVATVGSDSRIVLKRIELGRDYGTEVQVLAGLDSDTNVVLNPPDGLQQSQLVKVAVPGGK